MDKPIQSNTVLSDYLLRRGRFTKRLKRCYCILEDGHISYSVTPDDEIDNTIDLVEILQVNRSISTNGNHVMQLVTNKRVWEFEVVVDEVAKLDLWAQQIADLCHIDLVRKDIPETSDKTEVDYSGWIIVKENGSNRGDAFRRYAQLSSRAIEVLYDRGYSEAVLFIPLSDITKITLEALSTHFHVSSTKKHITVRYSLQLYSGSHCKRFYFSRWNNGVDWGNHIAYASQLPFVPCSAPVSVNSNLETSEDGVSEENGLAEQKEEKGESQEAIETSEARLSISTRLTRASRLFSFGIFDGWLSDKSSRHEDLPKRHNSAEGDTIMTGV